MRKSKVKLVSVGGFYEKKNMQNGDCRGFYEKRMVKLRGGGRGVGTEITHNLRTKPIDTMLQVLYIHVKDLVTNMLCLCNSLILPTISYMWPRYVY